MLQIKNIAAMRRRILELIMDVKFNQQDPCKLTTWLITLREILPGEMDLDFIDKKEFHSFMKKF